MIDELCDTSAPELEHVLDFQAGKPRDPDRGCVSERIRVGPVPGEGRAQCGQGDLVDSNQELGCRRRGEDLVEDLLKNRVGYDVQAQGGLAHLADALAQRRDMLGAEIRMMRKAG